MSTYAITEIDVLEHDTTLGRDNAIALLDSTHVVVAYAGSGLDGYIKIFEIDGSYNISETSSLEHDTTLGKNNAICVLDSSTVAVVYRPGTTMYVKVFSIDGSYNITEETLFNCSTDAATTFTDAAANVMWNAVTIDSSTFMAIYTRGTNDMHAMIFTVDGSYNITEEDEFQISSGNHGGVQFGAILIDTDKIMISCGDSSLSEGIIFVVSWNGSYVMSLENTTVIDATNNMPYSSLIHLTGDYYVTVGRDGSGLSHLYTLDLNTTTYAVTVIDELVDAETGFWQSLIKLDDTHFMLAREGVSAHGYVNTYSVDANADNITEIDELEHDTTNGGYNSMVLFDETHSVLVYEGTDADGFIKTFNIDVALATGEMDAVFNTDTEFLATGSQYKLMSATFDTDTTTTATLSYFQAMLATFGNDTEFIANLINENMLAIVDNSRTDFSALLSIVSYDVPISGTINTYTTFTAILTTNGNSIENAICTVEYIQKSALDVVYQAKPIYNVKYEKQQGIIQIKYLAGKN